MFLPEIVLLTLATSQVRGHGYLLNPPARNSMWRIPIPGAPKNPDDAALNCGGRETLWKPSNFGECGLCGDPIGDLTPRRNEHGGEFGKGVIVKTYTSGEVIDIEVVITAYHGGFLELKVCPADEETGHVTQECFDSHPLEVLLSDQVTTTTTTSKPDPHKFDCIAIPPFNSDSWCHNFYATAQEIPPANLCQCGKGLVPQVNGCENRGWPSDIPIQTNGGSYPTPFNTTTAIKERFYLESDCSKQQGTYTYRARLPQAITCPRCVLQWTYFTGGDSNHGCLGCGTQEWFRNCADIQIVSPNDILSPDFSPSAIPLPDTPPITSSLCLSTQDRNSSYLSLGEIETLDLWCFTNCLQQPPNCPPSRCHCVESCSAIQPTSARSGRSDFSLQDLNCQIQCTMFPPNCPADACHCTFTNPS